MRIGITDYVRPPFEIEQGTLGPGVELVDLDWNGGTPSDLSALSGLDGLLVWHAAVSAEVVAELDRCRVVVRYGVGVENLDVAALDDRGIVVCNTPDYGTEEVADTALAMIVGLHRRLSEYDEQCRWYESGWQEHTLSPLKRASETTVGIIGLGRIGSAVVLRLRALGYRTLGFDPYVASGHEKVLGCGRTTSLDEVLSSSDVVTLHCPLTRETSGIVDDGFIAKMPAGSILVNTARGGLVESTAVLERALRTGHLAAAGLDVLPLEPPGADPLVEAWRQREEWIRGRLLITPHTAYFSESAWVEMRSKAAETAAMVLDGRGVRNRITP